MNPGIQSAPHGEASNDELSDVELEEDRSSSLSEIEEKEPEQEDNGDPSDDLSDPTEDNQSEAETERLEDSPTKIRKHKDVVLSSHNGGQVYERSPSKLQNQILPDETDEPDHAEAVESLFYDDLSVHESSKSSRKSPPKHPPHNQTETDAATTTAIHNMEESITVALKIPSASEFDTRKRKRSIMAGSGFDDSLEEPLRKRTGPVKALCDNLPMEDELPAEDEGDNSKAKGDQQSEEEVAEARDDAMHGDVDEPVAAEDENPETTDIPPSPKRKERRKKKAIENGIQDEAEAQNEGQALVNCEEPVNGPDNADKEMEDEAEAALKTEEEFEKKRLALESLTSIEQFFTTFRDRLYDGRLEQLSRDEAMLKQDKPTHPEYLAMMKCVDDRRDERYRVADQLLEFRTQTLQTSAKATRSQILTQYQQDARAIRERFLERLGKMWYDIQHDRRTFAGTVPEYTLKFPTRKSEQVRQEVAYSNEVSILSGVAKYVGFPAAPPMAQASSSEYDEDMEKMGRTKHQAQLAAVQPLQELAAMRSAGPTARLRNGEEQFIEQTPWANAQHPSHAHLLQRQTSAQHPPRTSSPFLPGSNQPRRHSHHSHQSHQHGMGVPISGTFSNNYSSTLPHHPNGVVIPGGRISPHNSFTNSTHTHTVVPSPLRSRQPSLSPKQSRPPGPPVGQQQHEVATNNGSHQAFGMGGDHPRDQHNEGLTKREQLSATAGRL